MKDILEASQMKEADLYTIDEIGIPSCVLMEKAAMGVCTHLKNNFCTDYILVVCGVGNNGGDGLAAARILHTEGFRVSYVIVGDKEKGTEEFKRQYRIIQKYLVDEIQLSEVECNKYTAIIDALFGIGLSRNIIGDPAKIIDMINQSATPVLSVDIPSGVDADNGKILGTSIRADMTVSIAYEKPGHYLYPGTQFCGIRRIVDIGVKARNHTFHIIEHSDKELLKNRISRSNKGTYGKILIIAGNEGTAGAAFFSAKAAYKSGCGLVKIISKECNRTILQCLLPEAMFQSIEPMYEDKTILSDALKWADAIVIGPGMGTGRQEESILQHVLEYSAGPIVIDADALTLLSESSSLKSMLHKKCILTPHSAEMARLLHTGTSDVVEDLIKNAKKASDLYQSIIVLKDARSVITDGEIYYINTSGCNGMATGGSGDALTGIIAALTAINSNVIFSCAYAVYMHGLAGEKASGMHGDSGMIVSELLQEIGKI